MTATCGEDGESSELPGAMGIVTGHAGIETHEPPQVESTSRQLIGNEDFRAVSIRVRTSDPDDREEQHEQGGHP